MAKVNNYPYTNMVYQNVDWIVDIVNESGETSEKAMQIAQETALRVDGLEDTVNTHTEQIENVAELATQNRQAINRMDGELAEAITDIDDIKSNQIPRIDTELDRRVVKTNVAHQVYATDEHGERTTLFYNTGVSSDSIVQRTADGRIRASLPVTEVDVATKGYVDTHGGAKWTTVVDDTIEVALDTNSKTYAIQNVECEELKITTIIDNGDTNPESYTSTDLDVSVNGGFFYSIDGAVPSATSPVRKTEEFTNMYTWDWSEYGFGNVTAQILTGKKFTVSSLLDANVSITSYLSGDTYDVISVDEEEGSADAPGYRGYRVTFQQSGTTNERYGFIPTTVYSAICPGLEEGMLCICSFDAFGDISEFGAGYWSYGDTIVEHKIATGTLDMKYINTEMAETEVSGSGNRDDIDDGHIIPASNIKHYAIHPADSTISTVQVRVSNGVIREGTRIIIQYKK